MFVSNCRMQGFGTWRYVAVKTGSTSQTYLSKVTNQMAVSFRIATTIVCFAVCVLTPFCYSCLFTLFLALVVASSSKPNFHLLFRFVLSLLTLPHLKNITKQPKQR